MRKAGPVGISRVLFSSQLRINMASGVIVTVINSVVLAVGYPIYLHFLGYEQYGVWLVLATVVSFAQLGDLGIGQAVTKLVAEEHSRHDFDAVQQYVSSAVALLLASGVVVLALVLALQESIIALFRLSGANAQTVSRLLPYVACLSIYIFIAQIFNAAVAGMGRLDLAHYLQAGGRIVALLVAGVLLAQGRGISSLLLGSALSYVFIHLGSVVVIRRLLPLPPLRFGRLRASRIRQLLSFGTPVLGASLVNMLLVPFNKLMLARYAGVATVPVYEIAYSGSMQVRALLEAAFRALVPEVSRRAAAADDLVPERIRHLHRASMKMALAMGVPIYVMLLVVLDPLLHGWLQDRMTDSLPGAFRLMLVGSFLSLLGVPSYYTLLGLGRAEQCFRGQILLAGINVVLVGAMVMTGVQLSVLHVVAAALPAFGASILYLTVQNHRALQENRALPGGAPVLCAQGK